MERCVPFHARSAHHLRSKSRRKACISSATCCGISSMRSIVSHQAAGRCTLARDEIQPRRGLMICTALRAAMICQACGLDKKILVPKNEDFLAGAEGLGLVATTQSRGTFRLCYATSVSRGSDSPPDCHSLPLPFKSF